MLLLCRAVQSVFDYLHEEAAVVDVMAKGVSKSNRLQQVKGATRAHDFHGTPLLSFFRGTCVVCASLWSEGLSALPVPHTSQPRLPLCVTVGTRMAAFHVWLHWPVACGFRVVWSPFRVPVCQVYAMQTAIAVVEKQALVRCTDKPAGAPPPHPSRCCCCRVCSVYDGCCARSRCRDVYIPL